MQNRTRWQVALGTRVLYVSRTAGEAGEQEALRWLDRNVPYSRGVALDAMGYAVVPFEGQQARGLAIAA